MFHKIFVAASLAGALLISVPSSAHDGATGVVKERMELMKAIAKNVKVVAPIAMGSSDMDLAAVEKHSRAIADLAKQAATKFPEGSLSMVSEAKPNIWTNWDKFNGMLNGMINDATTLADLAKAEEEFELVDAFSKMANGCKACHNEFRERK